MTLPTLGAIVPVAKATHLGEALAGLEGSRADQLIFVVDGPDAAAAVEERSLLPAMESLGEVVRCPENLGRDDPSRAWNRGFESLETDLVHLHGDDDVIGEGFYRAARERAAAHPDILVWLGRLRIVDGDGAVRTFGWPVPAEEPWYETMFHRVVDRRPHAMQEMVVRRELLADLGGFPAYPLAFGTDDHLLIEGARRGAGTGGLDAEVSWRVHAGSISGGPFCARRIDGFERVVAFCRELLRAHADAVPPDWTAVLERGLARRDGELRHDRLLLGVRRKNPAAWLRYLWFQLKRALGGRL